MFFFKDFIYFFTKAYRMCAVSRTFLSLLSFVTPVTEFSADWNHGAWLVLKLYTAL